MTKEDIFKKIVIRIHELYVAVQDIDTKLTIRDQLRDQKIYSAEQKLKLAKGRAERSHRTHQLILIGSIWRDFLMDNNLYKYLYDAKYFEKTLSNIKNVSVDEEHTILDGVEISTPTSYTGRNKKFIHYFCTIGGMWESYWRHICKNDIRDKRIYKIFKQIENGNFDISKIDDDNYIDFKFFCSEKYCQKIGAFDDFFKNRCLKLDEKNFFIFLRNHKTEIIDALIQS